MRTIMKDIIIADEYSDTVLLPKIPPGTDKIKASQDLLEADFQNSSYYQGRIQEKPEFL